LVVVEPQSVARMERASLLGGGMFLVQ
jgi:hypothetical protein